MEITAEKKKAQRKIRARRTRFTIRAYARRPRLSVFRSGKHIYAQIIDDASGKTLFAASDLKTKGGKAVKGTPLEKAAAVGEAIAKLALAKNIRAVVFDRGGYRYHGRVKAVADGARKAGLQF